MSVRNVNCPGCGMSFNVPVALANAKCPGCATVWNVANPAAAQIPPGVAAQVPRPTLEADADGDSTSIVPIAIALAGGGLFVLVMIVVTIVVLFRTPAPSEVATTEVEETIKPGEPQEFRVVNLPEEQRRRIYDDYRAVARTTVEAPLALPQQWKKPRAAVENTLEGIYDRELMRFAALHDITVDDVKEIIKEGDAKVWDDSPRSNAVRDGKRVYSKERSEGWERNPNRK